MRIILLGAGGHGRVVLDAIRRRGEAEVVAFTDGDGRVRSVDGVPVAGTDAVLAALRQTGATHAVVTVGSTAPGDLRAELFALLLRSGLVGATVLHPAATISGTAAIGEGSVVLAGAVVNAGASVGRNVIINTAAVVEHDCVIADHVHVSPRAVLGGAVRVGAGAHIGLGASVLQGIEIGAGALVAAGATVTADVPAGTRVAGVPARPMD